MMLVDITPTSVQFLYNGKIHQIKEIMTSGKGLMIVTEEQTPIEGQDELIQDPNDKESYNSSFTS